jgi:ribosome-associated heat shock protein Hsp15
MTLRTDANTAPSQRLDKWLWCARFYKSRSIAAEVCRSRHMRIDGRVIEKPNANVRVGCVISFPWGEHVRIIRVLSLAERRGPATEARALYEDLSPRPAPLGARVAAWRAEHPISIMEQPSAP